MKKYGNQITKYWARYYVDVSSSTCSLCGNSGLLSTVGVKTNAGIEVGRVNYCICPNGQYMRDGDAKLRTGDKNERRTYKIDGG